MKYTLFFFSTGVFLLFFFLLSCPAPVFAAHWKCGCGDATPSYGWKTCDAQNNCILLNSGQGDCNANSSTRNWVHTRLADYGCNPGETWNSSCQSSNQKPWNHGPLRVSANGHFIKHTDGTPFFWFGDTAWSLFHRLNLSEASSYFQNRSNYGFTLVQASIIGVMEFGLDKSHNIANNERPFISQYDPTTPNPAFFSYVDAFINEAAKHDLFVALLPTWGGFVCSPSKPAIQIFNTANARVYGEFLGSRYKNTPNIIWVIGGDRAGDHCGAGDLNIWRAMANGINNKDPNHLMTFHGASRTSSSKWFHNDAWFDIDMYYSRHWPYEVNLMANEYNRAAPKPVVNGEARYDGYTGVDNDGWAWTEQNFRGQAYWALLGGCTEGYTFGHSRIWCFHKANAAHNIVNFGTDNYYDFFNTTLTQEMVYWKDFFSAREWWKLIPDQSIITSNISTKFNTKVAARSSDGDELFVYYPNTTSASIDMSKITSAAQADAKWWRPTNKSEQSIGTFPTSGTRSFTPPAGWDDALLVIEAAKICTDQDGDRHIVGPSSPDVAMSAARSMTRPALGANDCDDTMPLYRNNSICTKTSFTINRQKDAD